MSQERSSRKGKLKEAPNLCDRYNEGKTTDVKKTYQQSLKCLLSHLFKQIKGDKMVKMPENAAKLGMQKKPDVWMLLSTLVFVSPEARGN